MTDTAFTQPPIVSVPLHDAAHRAALRMPTIGQTHVFVANPSLQRADDVARQADCLQVLDAVEAFDGEPMTLEVARTVATDDYACGAVLLARVRWVATWRDAGVAIARCPACTRGDVELPIAALAAMLGVARAPIADARGRLVPFGLSFPAEREVRPTHAPLCARLAFRLASSALDPPPVAATEGVLASIDPVEEGLAWQRFAPIGVDPPDERDDWTFESAGFRAVLRIACALESFGARTRADVTPADVEPLPLGDFSFLDELYCLAFLAPAAQCPPVRCPMCTAAFLPVR